MRRFRTYQPKQQYLLPPSLDDWLPEDHLARFINEVVDELDLSAIFREYEGDGRGNPPYNPAMMEIVPYTVENDCVTTDTTPLFYKSVGSPSANKHFVGRKWPT